MDPIVHVSSNAALMPSPDRPLTPESPLGSPPGAYSQSKVEAERIARDLQADGAPVVILNPVGLLGPHDPHLGDFTAVARDVLRGRSPSWWPARRRWSTCATCHRQRGGLQARRGARATW